MRSGESLSSFDKQHFTKKLNDLLAVNVCLDDNKYSQSAFGRDVNVEGLFIFLFIVQIYVSLSVSPGMLADVLSLNISAVSTALMSVTCQPQV